MSEWRGYYIAALLAIVALVCLLVIQTMRVWRGSKSDGSSFLTTSETATVQQNCAVEDMKLRIVPFHLLNTAGELVENPAEREAWRVYEDCLRREARKLKGGK